MTVAIQPIRRRSELLVTLIERDMRLRAKRSFTGFVWPFVAPFLLLGLYTFVFGRVLKLPIRDYPVFLFAGLLPWTFLAQSLQASLQSISSEPELIHRAPFPHELLPLSSVGLTAAYFVVSLALFTAWVALFGRLNLLLAPVLVLPMVSLVLVTASLAMLMSLLDVYVRDLRLVLGNLLTVWLFLLPVVYTRRMVPGVVRLFYVIDPMDNLVGEFRAVLYSGRIRNLAGYAEVLLGCALFFGACLLAFRRFSARLAQDI